MTQPQEYEQVRERRAERMARLQREKRRRRRKVLMIAAVVLVAALIVIFLATGQPNPSKPADTTPQHTATTTTVAPTTTTTAPLPPPTPTWMTFPEDRELTAKQYFVYSCDEQTFLTIGGDRHERIYPASVTKLFTAYVALQHLDANDTIVVGDALDMIVPGSSVADLKRGDKITVEMLIEAMLLPSGNDAAYVLAVEIGRQLEQNESLHASVAAERFVGEMNDTAKRVGMTETHFANPDGIHSSDHYTTYADLAIMGKLALEQPAILAYTNVSRDNVVLESGATHSWKNTNEIINPNSEFYCELCIGLKTGQTPSAGSCLLSAFRYNDRTLIIGVFGCPDVDDRFADTLQLFNDTLSDQA